MKIKFFSKIFKPSSYKVPAQKAENRLQTRLTDWQNLMHNAETGDYFVHSTGKKFTGKFSIRTKELEQIYHIKNGKISIILIRDKKKKPLLVLSPATRKIKEFSERDVSNFQYDKLMKVQNFAEDQMCNKFSHKAQKD